MTQPVPQHHESQKPGEMTAMMRAAVAAGPKVLRLGVVRKGQVTEERIIRERSSVTVGSSEKNLVVVRTRAVPSSFRLFEVIDGQYSLNFTATMVGRIAFPSGVQELSELQESARRTEQGFRAPLSDETRGKVTLGDTTFLFQFVNPPPLPQKPRLPASVIRGASGVDWRTTVIAAFSFLLHFMAIGALYSDWLDPVVDTDVAIRTLVENVKSLPPPPPVEEKKLDDETDKQKETKEDKKVEKQVKSKKPLPAPGQKSKLSSAEVASLAAELDSFDLGILAASTGMTATADVLSAGDAISLAAMDRAAESGIGVSSGGPGGLKMGAAGGALVPGAVGNGLQDVGSTGKSTEETSGTARKVEGPKGTAQGGGTNVAGKVSDANRVVARMKAGLRACYNRGLANNPDIEGRVQLSIQVGPGGEVQSVTATPSGNLPSSVVNCFKARVRQARFSPPEGGAAAVTTSFTFVRQ